MATKFPLAPIPFNRSISQCTGADPEKKIEGDSYNNFE